MTDSAESLIRQDERRRAESLIHDERRRAERIRELADGERRWVEITIARNIRSVEEGDDSALIAWRDDLHRRLAEETTRTYGNGP